MTMPNGAECGVSARKRKSLLRLIDTIDTIDTISPDSIVFGKTKPLIEW